MKVAGCNPVSARQWLDEALRRAEQGGDRDVIASELRTAKRLLVACKTNFPNLSGPRRRRRRRR